MKAIGIVRVSAVGERDEDNFSSPKDQADRIRELCKDRWDLELYEPELNVSGAAPLHKRPQLSRAVTAVLTGQAQVIVGAWPDRLWRSTEVRDQVLGLVKDKGEVWTPEGQISNGSAVTKFTQRTLTGADEMYRDLISEKVKKAHKRVVANGIPIGRLMPGLVKVDDHIEVDEELAPAVREAVAMRADGASLREIQAHLKSAGIERSFHGVQSLLASPQLVGEIVFGEHRGTTGAVVVDRDLWERAQRTKVPRGPKPSSDRILARLGVLRCANCGSRMTVGRARGKYPTYTCGYVNDCDSHVTISARIAEEVVVAAARESLVGIIGVRSARENVREARARLAVAEEELDDFIDRVSGAMDREKTRERIACLQQAVANRQAEVDQIETPAGGDDVFVLLGREFDDLSTADQRRAIRSVIKAARVRRSDPGDKPADRIAVELWGFEMFSGSTPPMPTDLT